MIGRTLWTRAALTAVLCAAPAAHAQELPPELRVGAEIKLAPTRGGDPWIDGRVRVIDGQWLAVQSEDHRGLLHQRLDAGDYVGIRRMRPSSERMLGGLRWGAFLGASIGGIAMPLIAPELDSIDLDWVAVGVGMGGGLLVGGSVGALVGRILPSRRWEFVTVGAGAR